MLYLKTRIGEYLPGAKSYRANLREEGVWLLGTGASWHRDRRVIFIVLEHFESELVRKSKNTHVLLPVFGVETSLKTR